MRTLTAGRSARGNLRRAAAVLALGLVLATPTYSVANDGLGSSRDLPPAATAEQQLARELSFRSQFGLTTDLTKVEDIRSNSGNGSEEKYGVALSDVEKADIDSRFAVQEALGVYGHDAATLEGFAGFYVDQKSGGEFVLMMTRDGLDAAVALLAKRPTGSVGRVESVGRTAKDLAATRERIAAEAPQLAALGIMVTGNWVDTPANRVALGVDAPSEDATALLRQRYGPDLEVVDLPAPTAGACLNRSNCWNPAKAGLWITNSGANQSCTSGFVASDGIGGDVFLFTAGHCLGGSYTHNGSYIGSSVYSSYFNNSAADARIINITDSQESNYLFKSTSNLVHITAVESLYWDYVGLGVCTQSWYWGVNCGTITNIDMTVSYNGLTFIHQRRANYSAHSGDSGGPVYLSSSPTAEGLSAAYFSDSDWVFSQIQHAQQEISTPQESLLTCTTMTC
jgi:hypothetical protein